MARRSAAGSPRPRPARQRPRFLSAPSHVDRFAFFALIATVQMTVKVFFFLQGAHILVSLQLDDF